MPITSQLPLEGPGYRIYTAHCKVWGQEETIAALREVAADWSRAHDVCLGIGDISLQYGGLMPGHVSHRDGWDVDLRPIRNDGKESPVTYRSKYYSRALTQELVDRLYGNSRAPIATILFNDRQIAGCKRFAGHDNHLHVRFAPWFAALSEGARGPAVQQVQRRLNAWADAKAIAVDGDYGPITLARVRAFQAVRGLMQDGIVGLRTWGELRLMRPWEVQG